MRGRCIGCTFTQGAHELVRKRRTNSSGGLGAGHWSGLRISPEVYAEREAILDVLWAGLLAVLWVTMRDLDRGRRSGGSERSRGAGRKAAQRGSVNRIIEALARIIHDGAAVQEVEVRFR
jgi:hypothetical protein